MPAVALKWPGAHAVHVRSLDSVAILSAYSPAAHTALTGVHCSPFALVEYVMPRLHGAHVRSVVVVPTLSRPEPVGHVRHGMQASLPGLALKKPVAHATHVRSLVRDAAWFMYSPAVHTGRTV